MKAIEVCKSGFDNLALGVRLLFLQAKYSNLVFPADLINVVIAFPHLQDLQHLSDGLDGRSKNPLALLFDTLMQPNQDIGDQHPPSLSWTHEPHQAISHVVLGRGEAGGAWHRMDPGVLSLSPGRWLQLPIYGFDDWLKEEKEKGGEKEGEVRENSNSRVRLGSVARYYQRYVKKMGLATHFSNNITVTRAHPLCPKAETDRRSQSCESTFSFASLGSTESERNTSTSSPESEQVFTCCQSPQTTSVDTGGLANVGEVREEEEEIVFSNNEDEGPTACDSDDTGISCCTKRFHLPSRSYRWLVRGRRRDRDGQEECVCVTAKNLVLATGVNDSPKKLGVPGEDHGYVRHSFSDISPGKRVDEPVLVVGAGLAAADAVLHTLSQGHRVVHVFHQDTSDQRLLYHTMDPSTYTEYVTLFQKMSGRLKDPNYTPLPQHRVTEFSEEGVCTLFSIRDGASKTLTVSLALILIGGQPQLNFLPECMTSHLGVTPDQPINAKHNPIDLDPYTCESETYPSLFAMGPLSGDNFVRFVLGGAIGITKKLRENLK